MKKLLLSFLLLFCCSILTHAQQIFFCEKADSSGNPVKQSQVFKIKKEGGIISCLIKQNDRLETGILRFDIFKIVNGKENFESTFTRNIDPTFTWFSSQLTFKKTGDYVVYVYDQSDHLIKAGKVKLTY